MSAHNWCDHFLSAGAEIPSYEAPGNYSVWYAICITTHLLLHTLVWGGVQMNNLFQFKKEIIHSFRLSTQQQ